VTARALAGAARLCVDHVFAISHDVARVMGMVGFGRRVSQIPLGFDPELFRPSPAARSRVRHALGLGDEVVFAYFGRLSPEKGVDLFLHALAEMRDEPSWRLMLDEFKEYAHPYAQEVRRLIGELGLDDRIVYVDARHEDVGDFMNAADVVVVYSASNPHWNEQYGRVVPEAMACGRAVVVSVCGALPELAGDAGVVVPQRDVPALAAALRALLHDPARREALGRRGAERALERLSTVVQADLMAEVFRRWTAPSRVAPTRVGVAR
jgi:glycosyltransferase involved in cell wall biosynthesis